MRRGFRVFDTHTHVGSAAHSGRRYTADQLLLDMDRHGIERSLVIPFPVVADHRAEHDEIGQAVKEHPDRLTGTACINPMVGEAVYGEEVRRCVEQWGFRALKVQPQYQPVNPLARSSDFIFATAAEHKLPIVWHTGSGAPLALPSLLIAPARRFPDVTIIAGHAGGPLFCQEAIVAALTCPNIVVELSSLMPHHITEVIHHVDAARLMIGSDLPESVTTEIDKIIEYPIDDEWKRRVLWDNAAAVFLNE